MVMMLWGHVVHAPVEAIAVLPHGDHEAMVGAVGTVFRHQRIVQVRRNDILRVLASSYPLRDFGLLCNVELFDLLGHDRCQAAVAHRLLDG